MNIVYDDLIALALAGNYDVIVHGCNCHCRMKRGIAKTISELFPEAVRADNRTIRGDRTKLGTISTTSVERADVKFDIVNAYTQFYYGDLGVMVEYDAIRKAFRLIKSIYTGKRIAYPKIGAGLGGGDWGKIHSIIDEELDGEDHTCVILDKTPAPSTF